MRVLGINLKNESKTLLYTLSNIKEQLLKFYHDMNAVLPDKIYNSIDARLDRLHHSIDEMYDIIRKFSEDESK